MSEAQYGTDRIGKTSAGVFVSNALGVVLSLANSVFLTRTLGVVGRGEYALFSASFGLLALLLGLGLDSAIRYHTARSRIPADRLLTSLILFVLCAGGIVLGTAHANHTFFTNELFLPGSVQGLRHELLLAGVVMSSLFHTSISSVFAGHQKFTALNISSVALSAVSVLVFGVLFVLKQSGSWGGDTEDIFAAFLGLQLFGALVMGVVGYRILGLRWSSLLLDRALTVEMLRYASLAYVANLAQFLNYRVDIWIVQSLRGPEDLGLYSLAANLAMMLWLLPRAASSVLMPAMAADGSDVSFHQAARVARILTAMVILITVPVAALAGVWLPLLYGSDFAPSVTPLILLLLGSAPFALCIIQAGVLGGMNRVDVNLKASLVGLVATIVLDFLLIPRYGIHGAAAASAVSYILTTAVVTVAFARIGSISVRSTFLPEVADFQYIKNGLKSLLR